MNALLCIGCDTYDSMNCLRGAQADAKSVFDLLTSSADVYDAAQSILLLSPNLAEVREALKGSFPLKANIEGFTLFFAGHGAIAGTNFYLCVRDSKEDNFSMTALPISQIFNVITEFCPIQVNIVVDACAAGGSSLDLGAFIKPQITGSSTSTSIAFLGACSADQNAAEGGKHGFLTTELIRCLRGDIELQRRSAHLDLLNIGEVISPLVQAKNSMQRPLSWGLSLFGGSRFAKNPFYGTEGEHPFVIPDISPFSQFGSVIRERSADLWEIHRELSNEFVPRRLLDILNGVFAHAETSEEILALTEGLSSSLGTRAVESEDTLAASTCVSTCLVSLLQHIEDPEIESYLPTALGRLLDRNAQSQIALLQSIKENENCLLSSWPVPGDIYYLPLRVTKLLGWIGADILIQGLLPQLARETSLKRDLAEEIVTRYSQCLVAVSDDQAPSLQVFFSACHLLGWNDVAQDVLNGVYSSFCERKGNVTRCHTQPEQAVRYILSLTDCSLKPENWSPANPSHLLPVLLLWGSRFGVASDWDLRQLDRQYLNYFIPENPRDFSKKVIENGINHTFQFGFGLWTMPEFMAHYDGAIKNASATDTFKISPGGLALCVLSSLLFPDRVPFFATESLPRDIK
jgi:hypothetical protein